MGTWGSRFALVISYWLLSLEEQVAFVLCTRMCRSVTVTTEAENGGSDNILPDNESYWEIPLPHRSDVM